MKRLAIGLSISLLVASTASQAALVLSLDTTAKTFSLTGSDTGTPSDIFGQGLVGWVLNGLGGSGTDTLANYDNDVSFTTNVGTPGNSILASDITIATDDSAGGTVVLYLGMSSPALQTLTGTGAFQSYSSVSPGALARFESTIGMSLPLNPGLGTGFSSISVVSAAAIPEPSTYIAGAGFLALAGFMAYRRRKAKAPATAE
ncbi:PEP-CTERM sorting domain-containing protein [Cerasicoccus arenae]|uniref:PEP-CTERM protein-sorting domain-containing protein n=1 Tax=Cerasicoccus arenae TaxID=424488 RepID=A0A8J3GCJ2_9BACT|nr:PEP-CTERM sorting domain-containing protein [Cerasicoccus arenae]MBK1856934.1 PEP-CTERM sorting domain-containing protein [Cerasicoccus arenae]GHB89918.1 hypothetical protein GCM10007047_00580 [Cerasicoccus arenae]